MVQTGLIVTTACAAGAATGCNGALDLAVEGVDAAAGVGGGVAAAFGVAEAGDLVFDNPKKIQLGLKKDIELLG